MQEDAQNEREQRFEHELNDLLDIIPTSADDGERKSMLNRISSVLEYYDRTYEDVVEDPYDNLREGNF